MPNHLTEHRKGFKEALDFADNAVKDLCQGGVRQFMNQKLIDVLSAATSSSQIQARRIGFSACIMHLVEALNNALANDYHLSWDYEFQQHIEDVRAERGHKAA